jgi:3',5'-cyclic AMP phosphodiesterase CpdA
MATGTLGATQIEALERVLVSLATERVFRVLLVHHPLRSDSRPKRLTDSADLIALLGKHGVELILHGHDHIHSTMWFDGPDGKIPSIGVPAASALARGRHPAAAYNLYTIAREGNAWRCEQISRSVDGNLQVSETGRTRLI